LSYLFTFVSSFAVAVLFYFLSPWLCETQLHNPALVKPLQIGALLLFLTTFAGTQVSVMTGFQDFRGLAWTNGLTGLLSLPVMVGGAYYGGMAGAVCGAVIGAGVNLLVNSLFIYRNTKKYQIRYAFRQAYKELPVLWSSNIPIVLTLMSYLLSIWICQIWVGQLYGSSELGAYFAVSGIYAIVNFIPQNVLSVLFPQLTVLNSTASPRQYMQKLRKISWGIAFISTLAAIPFILFSDTVMTCFYGGGFAGTGNLLRFACAALVAASVSAAANQAFWSKGLNWQCFFYGIIYLLFYNGGVYLLLRHGFGAESIFISRIIADIVYAALCLLFVIPYYVKKSQ
jgi:O-antigen/teichoic acid export membrane protein